MEELSVKDALESLLSERPSRAAVAVVVAKTHRMATAYLLRKMRYGRLRLVQFGLSVEDLAWDCIADLFQSDESGRFIHIASYFRRIPWQLSDEAGYLTALHRLVCSKLKESLFRRYGEADLSLAKLIRNLKAAAYSTPGVQVRRDRELLVVVEQASSEQHHRPIAPEETLERYFVRHLGANENARKAISILVGFSGEHPEFFGGYPLSGLALVVRAAHVRLAGAVQESSVERFGNMDVENAIRVSINAIRREKYSGCVGGGKVDSDTYAAYFLAINDILASEYLNQEEPGSLFQALSTRIPGLDRATYARQHRNRLEYFASLCRARMCSMLADEPVTGLVEVHAELVADTAKRISMLP